MQLKSFRFGLALVSFLTLVGCAQSLPSTESSTVSLRIQGAVSSATVHIDDQYIGPFAFVERRGVALPPGQHRITVEKTGYFPWDRLVEVKEGDPLLRLDVELRRIPD